MPERRKVHCFEDLIVWQTGINLVKEIYRITSEGDFSRDFGLKDQLRRASVSVPTNVAEGFELTSRKKYLRHLNFAKGSARRGAEPTTSRLGDRLSGGLTIS